MVCDPPSPGWCIFLLLLSHKHNTVKVKFFFFLSLCTEHKVYHTMGHRVPDLHENSDIRRRDSDCAPARAASVIKLPQGQSVPVIALITFGGLICINVFSSTQWAEWKRGGLCAYSPLCHSVPSTVMWQAIGKCLLKKINQLSLALKHPVKGPDARWMVLVIHLPHPQPCSLSCLLRLSVGMLL